MHQNRAQAVATLKYFITYVKLCCIFIKKGERWGYDLPNIESFEEGCKKFC